MFVGAAALGLGETDHNAGAEQPQVCGDGVGVGTDDG